MNIVDDQLTIRTQNSYISSPHTDTKRSTGDHSDPWLRTASRAAAGVGMGISSSLLIIRVYTKARIMRKFWWDDVFIIIAWVLSVASQAGILYGYSYAGIGVHIGNLNQDELRIYPKTVLAISVLYLFCLACAELALLMFYYTLLNVMKFWKYVIYIVSGVIIGYTFAIFFAFIFACHPIKRIWDPIPQPSHMGHCINRASLYLATAVTNTTIDIILFLIPIRIIWGLHAPLRQKLGIAAIFGIGCMAITTSIVRLVTVYPLMTSNDQPYKLGLASLLAIIEGNFVIICGCLLYLRQFLRRHAPRLMSDGSNRSSSETQYQAKGVVVRRARVRTTTPKRLEQSQEIPQLSREDPQYSV